MPDDTTDDGDEPDVTLDSSLRANEEFATGVRLGIAAQLGQTGFNDSEDSARNHFEVFGWPRDVIDGWDEENWLALYLRNAYARIVVEKPAFTTWRDDPDIVDPRDETTDAGTAADGEATTFERAVEKTAQAHDLWTYCERVDRAAGIGQHGLLLIGLSDVAGDEADLSQWATDAREADLSQPSDITGLKPILGAQIEDIDYGDLDSERWGLPVEYTVDLGEEIDSETEDDDTRTIRVHWTRVVDAPATRLLDDETLARPRMEPVLNNLLDIEKTLGAAAEAAYRAADYGLHLDADPTEVDLSGGMDDLADELQRYEQGLQRYLRTSGVEVERLGGDIQDPSGIVENNLDAIAGQTGIPKKEFRGNESGEVSGAEADERSYFGMIAERRTQYATPHIVRSVIDRFQLLGIIPAPAAGEYRVSWPDLTQLSASDQADIQAKRAQVIQAVPGLAGDLAMRYLKEGADALPTDEAEDPLAANLDEGDDAVRETFEMVMGNADAEADDETGSDTDLDLTPPEAAQENAQQVLDWREDDDKDVQGMTDVGWGRAEQLASGAELSPEVVKAMAQFNRHRENAPVADEHEGEPWRDAGHVAWLGWGGDAGIDWALRMSEELTDNATRYSEGDEVSTPQGVGVVADVLTSTVEADDETIEASDESPTYVVVVEDGRVGYETYAASEIHATTIETDVDATGALAEDEETANALGRILDILAPGVRANDFDPPPSWRKSSTPSRVIALKAFASMGASFDGCVREMRGTVSDPDEFCGSFLDYVVGNPYWRGDSILPGD